MTIDELEAEIFKLPLECRAKLAHRILLSLNEAEEPDPDHERLWLEEIERRYCAVREGTTRLTPACPYSPSGGASVRLTLFEAGRPAWTVWLRGPPQPLRAIPFVTPCPY